jgi:hypothetical protein
MDKRKIIVEKGNTFYDTLNSDDLNLEIANNLENIFSLREIIKMKARQMYLDNKETKRVITFFQPAKSLDDNPKYIYIFGAVGWVILFRAGLVPKYSLLFLFIGLNFFFNWKRQRYCKAQKEYEDFKKINDLYHHIVYLKKKSMTTEYFLSKAFKVDYNNFLEKDKFNYVKYEYLY